jgi:hypothetical protein
MYVNGQQAASNTTAPLTNQYDGNGNQTRKVESSGDTEYVFDVRDRLSLSTQRHG